MSTTSNQGLKLKLQRIIDTTPDELFDAWLSPDVLAQWFKPEAGFVWDDCQINPTETGVFRFTLISDDKQHHHIITGHYIDLDEPNMLSFTWSWELPQKGVRDTICSIIFSPISYHPDQTELTVLHSGFANQEIYDEHLKGWVNCLDALAAYFSSSKK